MLKELLGDLWTQEIEDALNGKVEAVGSEPRIPKSRFDEVNNAKKELDDKVKELMTQLENANKGATDVEVLKVRINELTQEHDEYVQRIEKEKVNSAKKTALTKMLDGKNALNSALLLQFYDLDKLTLADDGILIGAKETTDRLLVDYPDQFGKVKQKTPNPNRHDPKDRSFKDMSLKERLEWKAEDPDGYQKARQAYYNN